MNNEENRHEVEHKPLPVIDHGPFVTIEVDNVPVQIHRGHHTVAEIKTAGHVPLAYDLEQIVHGKLIPLPDDGSVTIKGGESFVGHPKDNQSS